MKQSRPAIFRGRHFEPEIIATCVPLVLTLFAKPTQRRGNDGRTPPVGRPTRRSGVGCQRYGPMIYHRLRGKLRYTTTTWHMDETYVRVAGRWGVSVPCGGQSRRHGRLLFVGNARS